jgi:hypothetical protein
MSILIGARVGARLAGLGRWPLEAEQGPPAAAFAQPATEGHLVQRCT